MKKTTIWLSEADIELRDQLAAQLGTTASDVIRRALYQMQAFHLRGLKTYRKHRQPASQQPPQSPQERSTGPSADH